jgi:uncharacterized protein (DUF2342 family)
MMDTKTQARLMIDFDRLATFHGNLIRAGLPVLEWDTFRAASDDLMAADADLQTAIREVSDWIDSVVPAQARMFPAYHLWYGPAVENAYGLLLSDRLPLLASESDLRFSMAYGKRKLNPLGHMTKRTREFRSAAVRLRRELARCVASHASM